MASYRDIKQRIGGVQNIQQITRAMKMVAAARLRRAEESILALRPYASRLDSLTVRFLSEAIGSEHAFMEQRPVKGVAVLAICSDRGLCGAYNNRIVDAADRLLRGRAGQSHRLLVAGSRGTGRLKRAGWGIHKGYVDVLDPVHVTTAVAIREELTDLFLAGEVDEVLVVFTEFFSPMRQFVVMRRLLPCNPQSMRKEWADHYVRDLPAGLDVITPLEESDKHVYIYEPDYDTIGARLLERNLTVQVYRALLEAQASEHGARMMAMDNATTNAEEMVDELTLQMNRSRQESITNELLDVVGGAEAMK